MTAAQRFCLLMFMVYLVSLTADDLESRRWWARVFALVLFGFAFLLGPEKG